jgi:hypothetical protein
LKILLLLITGISFDYFDPDILTATYHLLKDTINLRSGSKLTGII